MNFLVALLALVAFARAEQIKKPLPVEGYTHSLHILANQETRSAGGHDSTLVSTGTANAKGRTELEQPYEIYEIQHKQPIEGQVMKIVPEGIPVRNKRYYPSYYRPSGAVTANQQSYAAGGHGSTVVAQGTANAYGGQGGYGGYGRYKRYAYMPSGVTANQQTNALGGAGSTVVGSGTANAVGQPYGYYNPGGYGGYGQYGQYGQYGGYSPVTANQQTNAVGGYGSTVVGTGQANAVGGRPWGGYGGYSPVTANQQTNAVGGYGSTVVGTGTANASG